MGKFMHAAIESGNQKDCGYACAVRDLVVFIEVAEAPTAPRKSKPVPSLDHARRFNNA